MVTWASAVLSHITSSSTLCAATTSFDFAAASRKTQRRGLVLQHMRMAKLPTVDPPPFILRKFRLPPPQC